MHPMLPGTRPLSRSSAPIVQREEKKRKVLRMVVSHVACANKCLFSLGILGIPGLA